MARSKPYRRYCKGKVEEGENKLGGEQRNAQYWEGPQHRIDVK